MSRDVRPLFIVPDEQARADLELYGKVLRKVFPLKHKHRRILGDNIKRLSHTLTDERGGLAQDYLSAPATLSAYVHYFLPWNLYRFIRLFRGLQLRFPEKPTIMDIGAGPLTTAQALWIAFPQLRETPVRVICQDRTPKAMRTGLGLFKELAMRTTGKPSPWRIDLRGESLQTGSRDKADLVVCANTLNELNPKRRKGHSGFLEKLSRTLAKSMDRNGSILVIEPGTRRAASRMAELREVFIEAGLNPFAPCPHFGACPMPGVKDGPWCHFNFPALDAPAWLKELSEEARLGKKTASMSFLAVSRDAPQRPASVRCISQQFSLPHGHVGQYGCSSHGLTLLKYASKAHAPGTLVRPSWPENPQTDAKSQAVIAPMTDKGQSPALKEKKVSARPERDKRSQDRKQRAKQSRGFKGRPGTNKEKTGRSKAARNGISTPKKRGGPKK